MFSAFFSGSETAYFNLTRRQAKNLRQAAGRLQKLAGSLISKPAKLLGTLLFGNMLINVLYFAIASTFTVSIEREFGVTAAIVAAASTFAAIVCFGEIFPKSFAFANARTVSVSVSVPMYFLMKAFSPLVYFFNHFAVTPITNVLLGPRQKTRDISTDDFKALIAESSKRGLITADENKFLSEVIELGFLKVRNVMCPRVDIVACKISEMPENAIEMMRRNGLTKIPVYRDKIDNIQGLVYLRDIVLNRDKPLGKLITEANFVPEQKSVESLLEFFRDNGVDIAIVVDEYGGLAGTVRLEDIAEELLGPIDSTSEPEPVEQIGPFEFRLSGNLAIHDWAAAFHIDIEESQIATLGGLVTALIGRIPKPGDTAYLRNLKFTVEKVKKHRVQSIILKFEPIKQDE